jgi:catechol 2,3-dioxygenase-like lactoylglutathione lyase family enzyme
MEALPRVFIGLIRGETFDRRIGRLATRSTNGQQRGNPMTTDTFAFTKLIVGDLERSAAFYREVCGLTEQTRISGAVAGRAMTEIILAAEPPGAATLILFAFHDAPAPSPGDSILGFQTADIAAFIERAKAAGGSVVQAVTDLPEHRLKFAFVRDNEGHLVEALQRL